MTDIPKGGAERVRRALAELGQEFEVRTFPQSTRTSEEAAAAIGCAVGQIAKSLIFRARDSGRPVLVIASGTNRVDEKAVSRLLGEKIARADAAFVREVTGYAIGGVPPFAHKVPPIVFLDRDLLAHDGIWAAAGAPNAVFALSPRDLPALTGGIYEDIKKV